MASIRELRRQSGLTQKEFAYKYDIPIRTIQKWERNGSTPPRYIEEAIEKIDFLEQSELMFDAYWRDEKTARVRSCGQKIYIERLINHPVKQIFFADEMSRFQLGEILRTRCWDEKRKDLPRILEKLGLTEFNPYEICRITHGKMYQDSIWFRYPGELITYEEIRRNIY